MSVNTSPGHFAVSLPSCATTMTIASTNQPAARSHQKRDRLVEGFTASGGVGSAVFMEVGETARSSPFLVGASCSLKRSDTFVGPPGGA